MSNLFDLVIRNGLVVNGTGQQPFTTDVGIRDGTIASIGDLSAADGREIVDAAGCIVTPGFVDVHTHYDGQVTWEHTLAPSSTHGVTTVVMGNCGVGFAPIRAHQRELAIKLMEGVEDIPEVVMAAGLPWNWETFPDYLDALEQRHTDIDFGTQLPHSPLRVYVMGERGANLEPPTDADLEEMRRLTAEAVSAGALGVSTSRALVHRFRDGRHAPSVLAEEDEIMALAHGLRDAGAGVFQLIPNLEASTHAEFALIERIQARSGRPISFSLAQDNDLVGGWQTYLRGVASAAAENKPIRGQFFPRPVGLLFGLDLSLHPFSLNPSYKRIADEPLDEKIRIMRDPQFRARLLSEEPDDPNPFLRSLVGRTELLFSLGNPPCYTPDRQSSIKARAGALGIDPKELIYDELLEENGHAILYCPIGNLGDQLDRASLLAGQPGTLLGLGDGGAHYGMVCDAGWPTYFLQTCVRDAAPDLRIELALAIRIMSRDPAEAVGLYDRGLIKPGYKADLNIIDLDRLHLHSPHVLRDLPANGRRVVQRAEGYVATVVSGQITYREGNPTGRMPGRLIRGGQPDRS